MEITFVGHACFKIKGKTASVVIDPYDPKKTGFKLPKLSADIVLSTHGHDDHNYIKGVSDASFVVTTAGEYETKDVYIEGIQTLHDEKDGSERGKNVMYQIHIDGFTVLHMGDLGHELSKETLEKLVEIDVLLIPVGGTYTIDAKTAAKVISSVEPAIVVPMHYRIKGLKGLSEELDPVKKFLDEMGVEKVTEIDKLKLSTKSDVPEETQVIVITPTKQ